MAFHQVLADIHSHEIEFRPDVVHHCGRRQFRSQVPQFHIAQGKRQLSLNDIGGFFGRVALECLQVLYEVGPVRFSTGVFVQGIKGAKLGQSFNVWFTHPRPRPEVCQGIVRLPGHDPLQFCA
ncbi:hypothetical protein D3C73_1196260 [compost metagenome]